MADAHSWLCRRGVEVADRFVAGLYDHMARLALIGHPGAPRDEVRPGLRIAVHGRFVIWFRVTDAEMIVLRVVRGARDTARLDLDEDE